MRAVYYERLGAARDVLKLGAMETPPIGLGEVCVRVRISGINPSDVKRRGGQSMPTMPFPRVIPHQDGAGVIEAVGAGVAPTRVGERVWLYEAQLGRPFGTAAEWVVLPSAQAVRLPDMVDFVAGASLGVPAMTAHRCVFADGPVTGQTVLVAGGAGAVGYYAIQLAKWGGAQVITTVSAPAKAEVARTAGADHVVNYRNEDVAAHIRELTGGSGVDRVVEVAFGYNLALNERILKPNGAIASYASDAEREPRLPYYAFSAKNATIHFVLVYVMSKAAHQAAIDDITTCLETGVLRHPTPHRFALEDIVTAHEAVESGQVTGKAVVEMT
jgi:NADPH:quinone reductase